MDKKYNRLKERLKKMQFILETISSIAPRSLPPAPPPSRYRHPPYIPPIASVPLEQHQKVIQQFTKNQSKMKQQNVELFQEIESLKSQSLFQITRLKNIADQLKKQNASLYTIQLVYKNKLQKNKIDLIQMFETDINQIKSKSKLELIKLQELFTNKVNLEHQMNIKNQHQILLIKSEHQSYNQHLKLLHSVKKNIQEKNDILYKQNQQMAQKLQSIKTETDKQKQQNKKQVNKMLHQVELMRKKIDDLSHINDQSMQIINNLKKQNQKIIDKNQKNNKRKQQLQHQINELNEKNNKYQRENQSLNDKIFQLKQQLDQFKRTKKQSISSQRDKTKKQGQSLDLQFQKRERTIESKRKMLQQDQKKFQIKRKQIQNKQKQLQIKQKQLEEKQKQLKKQFDTKQFNNNLQNKKIAAENKVSQLNQKIRQINQKHLKELQKHKQRLKYVQNAMLLMQQDWKRTKKQVKNVFQHSKQFNKQTQIELKKENI